MRRCWKRTGAASPKPRMDEIALASMEKDRPSLIFLDLLMPVMDGFEFADRVRRTSGLAHDSYRSGDRSRPHLCRAKAAQRLCRDDSPEGWPLEGGAARVRCAMHWTTAPCAVWQPYDIHLKHMPKILLVEDNEMNRDMLSRRLQRRGYEVLIAVDGQKGSRWRRAETPDLILMDMSLPVIDGWEATRTLKAADGTRAHSGDRTHGACDVDRSRKGASRRAATTTTRSRSSCRGCSRKMEALIGRPASSRQRARLSHE